MRRLIAPKQQHRQQIRGIELWIDLLLIAIKVIANYSISTSEKCLKIFQKLS
jgi:hypothetical protein